VIVADRRPSGKTDRAGADVDVVVGCDHPLFESGAGRDDLERRARLVQILHGPIPPRVLAEIAVGVGIERWVVRHRQDLAGRGIHDDGGAAAAAAPLHAGLQLAFGDVLKTQIDRQLE
jgi:hypothetical protein